MDQFKVVMGEDWANRHAHKETVAAGQTSQPVIVALGGDVRVSGTPGAGTVRVEYTLSSLSDVNADTATWFAWSAGDSNVAATEVLAGPVTAVRAVAVTDAATFEALV